MKKKLLLVSTFVLFLSVFNSKAIEATNFFEEPGFEETPIKAILNTDGSALCYVIDGTTSSWKYVTEPTSGNGSYLVGTGQETTDKGQTAYDYPKTAHSGRYLFCNHKSPFYQTINLQPGKYELSFNVARIWGASGEPNVVVSKDGNELLNESYFSATNSGLFKTYSYILDITQAGDYKFLFGDSQKCFLFYDDFSLTLSDGIIAKVPSEVAVSIGNPKDFKYFSEGSDLTQLIKGNTYTATLAYDAGNDEDEDYSVDSVSIIINELDTVSDLVVDGGNNFLVTLKTDDFIDTKSGSIDVDVVIPTTITSSINLPMGHIYQMYVIIANNKNQTASYIVDQLKELVILDDGQTSIDLVNKDVDNIFTKAGVVYLDSNSERMIDIFSVSGVLVKKVKINAGMNIINGLPEGIYLIDNKKIRVRI